MKKVYEAPVIIIEELISEGEFMCYCGSWPYKPPKHHVYSMNSSDGSDDDCLTCEHAEECEYYNSKS